MAEADLAARPGERFFERDVDVVAQVAAADGRVAALLRVPPRCSAEEHVEDVPEAVGAERPETAVRAAVDAGMSEPIVVRAFLRVREDLVRFVDFLEDVLGDALVFRDVGMIAACQLTVRAFDRRLVRVASDAEDLVIVGGHVTGFRRR